MAPAVTPAWRRSWFGAATALAVTSLLVPAAPLFDAWAWLGWGAQLRRGALDTAGPTSWKPLAGGLAFVVSWAGDAAPTLWLLVVRLSAVLALVLVAHLAARLSSRPVLGAAVAVTTALALRHVVPAALEGASEVLLITLVVVAMAAGLPLLDRVEDTRSLVVVAALAAAGGLRPEVWPLAFATAAVVASRVALRARVIGGVLLLAMLGSWFLPTGGRGPSAVRDSPLAASTGPGSVLVDALTAAPVAAVLLAIVAVAVRGSARDRAVLVLAVAAAAWTAVAVVEGAVGFPALARFVLPVGPLVAVLAGVGAGVVTDRLPRAVTWVAIAALVLEVALPRARDAGREVRRVEARAEESTDLTDVVDRAGRLRLGRAEQLCVDEPFRSQLAFLVDRPLSSICSGPGFSTTPRDPRRPAIVVSRTKGAWTVVEADGT